MGVITTLVYDAKGHLLSNSTPITGGTATTSYTYDTGARAGDLLSVTDPKNRTSRFTYDANGNRASASDPATNQVTYFHDSVGRLTSEVSPLGNVPGAIPSQYSTRHSRSELGRQGSTSVNATAVDGATTSTTSPANSGRPIATSRFPAAASRLTSTGPTPQPCGGRWPARLRLDPRLCLRAHPGRQRQRYRHPGHRRQDHLQLECRRRHLLGERLESGCEVQA